MLFSHTVFTDHLFFPSLLHWIVSLGLQALLSLKSKLSADRLPALRARDRDCVKGGVSAGSHRSDSPSTAKEALKKGRGLCSHSYTSHGQATVKCLLHRHFGISLQDLIPQLPTGPCPSRKSLCGTTQPPTPAPLAGNQHVLHSLH